MKRNFAKRLKEARLEAGYRATQFAQAMGEEEHTYRAWERGQYLPKHGRMARLCRLLGLEPNELVPLACAKKGCHSEGIWQRKMGGMQRKLCRLSNVVFFKKQETDQLQLNVHWRDVH